MKAKQFRILTFSVVGVLLAIVIAVNVAASMFGDTLIGILSGSAVSSATRGQGEALAEQIVEEGTVLVKNEDSVLPLHAEDETETKINVFGWASVNWVTSGSGSGRSTNDGNADLSKAETTFLKALEGAGIEYNTGLSSFYSSKGTRNSYAWDTLHGYDYESCRLVEPAMSEYSESLLSDAEAYSDVAIVVLSRVAGESTDAPLVQYKGASVSSTPASDAESKDLTYLDASTEERELLAYVGEKFEKVIVLINSTNRMNLNFMDEIEGLDACLVTGGTGNNAATGLVNLLYGQKMYETPKSGKYGDLVSPSGRLTDTYPYDFRTESSWANTGNLGVGYYDVQRNENLYPYDGTSNGNFHDNPNYGQVSYLDYVEDIYVGYKWFETADAEHFWDSAKAQELFGVKGYDNIVQYPFGYGLSYTNFSWRVKERPKTDDITFQNVYDDLSFTVEVTNEGDFPAQEVVELYYTPPYISGGIEKSAVNLLAFAKTPVPVEPGQSQDLTLTFSPADMGSYDSHTIKTENGGWVLEEGDYTLSLRTDAHTVADINGATFKMTAANDLLNYDEEESFNLFTGDDAMDFGISVDGSNSGANITYLTRKDFENTFPTVANDTSRTKSTKHRAMAQTLKDHNLYRPADAQDWANRKKVENGGEIEMPTLGAKNNLKIFDDSGKIPNDLGIALGADYDNEQWDDVLDQLTYNELRDLALHGYIQESALPSVGKATTTSLDGPSQFGSFNVSPPGIGIGYPNPSVLGQTWNPELAKSFGLAVAGEAGESGRQGWYAPGVNLHRSAFGGRNYEYYSEDSFLSGVMAAKTVEGSLDAGVYVYAKHIIGYDQETARDALYCWMTEQALRETYMKPFKLLIDMTEESVGGTAGIMTSYGRIGAVWAGGSEALITGLLRDEWGYHGSVLTDYADHKKFMNGDQMVRAGGDMWMDGVSKGNFGQNGVNDSNENNAAFVTQLREGAHHVLYTICNAAYVNSMYNANSDKPIIKTGGEDFPLWTIIGVVDGVVIAGCAVWVVLAILKKDKTAAVPEGGEAEGAPEDAPEDTEKPDDGTTEE